MLNVVISRKRWGMHSLRDSIDDRMCCMGFACRTAGYAARTLVGRGMVCDLLNEGRKLKEGLEKLVRSDTSGTFWEDTIIAAELARVNDDECMEDEIKEKTIIKLGKKAGINFSFIN